MAVTALYGMLAAAQAVQTTPKQLVEIMIAREQSARLNSVFFSYLSEERSERTSGHLWEERMVETAWGTVRYLLAVDGQPLTKDQVTVERSRLKVQTSSPESYKKAELKLDESEHSRQMLAVLPKAFLFDILNQNGQEIRIGYRPDPAFQPASLEQRSLYGMTGIIVLDAKTLRLHQLEGHAPKDVNLGYGPFATLRAGSSFMTNREAMEGAIGERPV